MNNLKKKIMILLTSILTIFLLTIIVLYNFAIYNKEKKDLLDKIIIVSGANERFKPPQGVPFNPMFIENEVYEVEFNNLGEIEKITSYYPDGLNYSEVEDLINKNKDKINNRKVESLYTSEYIFILNKDNNLLIINNNNTKSFLLQELLKSILIFILLEIIIVLLSYKITNWIVKPVKDAFEKQKQFVYDASHELKTPIAIIRASIETLENNPKEKKWIKSIKSENERMGKLVSNLLDLSKSENLKETETYLNINLSKLIEQKALSFESLIFENGLKLELDIEKDIYFTCSEGKIKELLNILVDNAIKHSLENANINIKLYKEKSNIILSVKNRGKEIPINEREKIFERFYRTDESRNRDENRYGLGLSIAKNIVENHKGTIKVECEDGYTSFITKFK